MQRWTLAALIVVGLGLLAWAADRPVAPGEAPGRMTLPDGFRATLFAGEPDVVQPIAFTFDDRGRMWVVECLSYPNWTDGKAGNDRVTIYEDADGDGRFDRRTVFWDKGRNLSGIALGFGGVWLCSTPELVFVPDRDGDDKPDGPPEVVLDGWDLKARHNVFNGLTWGPDGWLYGCNGILSNSKVGAPGTPEAQRTSLNCGVWRYHPTRKEFEAFAHGTTNPWGLDFDDHGEAFITNCVIHHLFHVIPGGHFERMFGQDINPHSYGLLKSVADYIHWGGGHWTSSRGGQGVHSDAGGGHAHSGAVICLADGWPAGYRGSLLTCNIHGNRLNRDGLDRKGSGYAARREKDFLFANDPWFRGIAVHQGPDGGLFVSDWCDTGECHNYVVVDRTNGRIHKITPGTVTPFQDDLAKKTDLELVKLQLHRNDWHVRHARRLLQERAARGRLDPAAIEGLRKILADEPDPTRKLRALWALHAVGALTEADHRQLFDHADEYVRGWAVRLSLEGRKASDRLPALAAKESSAYVRLQLASGLQRLPAEQRWAIAEGLVAHAEDAADACLPLMIWYGVEPLPATDVKRSLELLAKSRIPLVREYLARRAASLPGAEAERLQPLIAFLAKSKDDVRRDVLHGTLEAVSGRRTLAVPVGWETAYARLSASEDAEVRDRALTLAVLFDDPQAMASLRRTVLDARSEAAVRQSALQRLIFKQKPEMLTLLHELLTDRVLRAAAVRGLAAFADERTPELILAQYAGFAEVEKADAVQTLASRPTWAAALLDAVEKGKVDRRDVSAFTLRQLATSKDARVSDRVAKVWGVVRATSADRLKKIQEHKNQLQPEVLKAADRTRGRALYGQHCAACHKLFGEGGDVGPELTGSQRNSLDYILENVVDPSAVVAREYQVHLVELKNGRVINGIVKAETDRALTLRTQNETVIVPREEIESRTASNVSIMPEGLFDRLSRDEIRDLIGYLSSPAPEGAR